MCTLVVGFYPQTEIPLVVVANRDENPLRPAIPMNSYPAEDGVHHITSPIDVLGGTWIGCNSSGIFAAITNWDILEGKNLHGLGLKSRGHVVSKTLNCTSEENILSYWKSLKGNEYKPFNILAGGRDFLLWLSCDNYHMNYSKKLAGLYISTGLGFNKTCNRDSHIRSELVNSFTWDRPIHPDRLEFLMSSHNDGIGSEDSVCVHDIEHRWETRSSCSLCLYDKSWLVRYIDKPPCMIKQRHWNELELRLA